MDFCCIYKKLLKIYQQNIIKKNYKAIKERVQKKSLERYQKFSAEKKEEKKWQYGREHYKNLSEDKRNELVEHRKKALFYNYKKLKMDKKI